MKEFIKGVLYAYDGKASMARTMAWIAFFAFLISWFVFPERNNTDIIAVWTLTLGYALTGKLSFQKHNNGYTVKKEERENPCHSQVE